MVNACRKPGEWQTYDIVWEGPRFDKQGKLLKPAYVTVLQNGVVVQNHFELEGGTSYVEKPHYTAHAEKDAAALAVPRQSGPLPQYLDPRDQGHRGKPGDHPHHPG